jgi:hypothetical protein
VILSALSGLADLGSDLPAGSQTAIAIGIIAVFAVIALFVIALQVAFFWSVFATLKRLTTVIDTDEAVGRLPGFLIGFNIFTIVTSLISLVGTPNSIATILNEPALRVGLAQLLPGIHTAVLNGYVVLLIASAFSMAATVTALSLFTILLTRFNRDPLLTHGSASLLPESLVAAAPGVEAITYPWHPDTVGRVTQEFHPASVADDSRVVVPADDETVD